MAQIAVTIVDSKNNRSAHLVETTSLVRDLIPPIVVSLKWPRGASYQLFQLGSASPLPVDKTLAQLGVLAGAELLIRPIRNPVLKVILEKLYEEAQGYAEDQAWELAKEKLAMLLLLDPLYPDPAGLQQSIEAHLSSLRNVPPIEEISARQPTASSRTVTTSANVSPPAPLPAAPVKPVPTSEGGGGAYQLTQETAKSSGAGCVGIALMIVGVLVAGAIAVVGARAFLPDLLNEVAARIGVLLPGETILGTGDVQVTLRWEGEADLDLAVVDPAGEKVWFGSPQSGSGGILDVDANGNCEGVSSPVENIYWPKGEAPPGEYSVLVTYFQACEHTGPVDYEVTITLDGDVMDVISAQMTAAVEEHPVITFTY
jgi:hypothetical protein